MRMILQGWQACLRAIRILTICIKIPSMKPVIALIFGIAIVISSWLFSYSWKNTHHLNDIITVKGSAKKDFTSDLIIWEANFNRKAATIQEAYSAIKRDADTEKKY